MSETLIKCTKWKNNNLDLGSFIKQYFEVTRFKKKTESLLVYLKNMKCFSILFCNVHIKYFKLNHCLFNIGNLIYKMLMMIHSTLC